MRKLGWIGLWLLLVGLAAGAWANGEPVYREEQVRAFRQTQTRKRVSTVGIGTALALACGGLAVARRRRPVA
jgi:hypothetical protein